MKPANFNGHKNMPKPVQGVLPVVQTPFSESDEIDFAALKRQVDWAFEVGADGIGTGMVSEVTKLTHKERSELTHKLPEFAAGRGAVFVSIGAESTRQAVLNAREAARAGCDAVMAVPPMTTAVMRSHLTEYFTAIADSMDLPLIVQDASGYVGQAIPMSVYRELLDRFGPEKILFKPEAAPIGSNLSDVRDANLGQAKILEGSGGIFLVDSFRRGIIGTIPGMDLLDGIVALWRALKAGDDETAYRLAFPISSIVALQMQAGLDGFLAIEKHLLVKRGLMQATRRRHPYRWELDEETAQEADRLFDRLQQTISEL
jgi:dihydrodipicolinate synthase/N-acetylneuraminate lyase